MSEPLSDWEQEILDRMARLEAFAGIGPHDQEPDVNVGAAHAGNAGQSAEDVEATDAARAKAEELGVDIAAVEPSGASGQVVVSDVTAAAEPA